MTFKMVSSDNIWHMLDRRCPTETLFRAAPWQVWKWGCEG